MDERNMSKRFALKQIFDQYAEETICDERARNLHAPVLKMIEEGRFDKPRRSPWWPQALVSASAVAMIAIVAAFAHDRSRFESEYVGTLVEIPDAGIPLVGTPFEGHTPSSFVIMPEDGVEFSLVNEDSRETFRLAVVGVDGAYTFSGVPDGSYRLMALTPSAPHDVEVIRLTVENERVMVP